jgi:DNA repair exonuclease SbcCD ATPase subunit
VENFPIVVCLIPAALVGLIAGLYFLARYFQKQTESDLQRLRSDWRSYDSARQQIEQSIQAYTIDQQEPFISRVAGLQALLEEINQQSGALSRRRVDLKQQANNLGANRWSSMGAPYLWYFLHKNTAQLSREIEAAWAGLENAGQMEQELHHLGWSVALQARQVRRLQRQTHKTLNQLQACNLQGDTFEAALRQEQQAQATLAQLPAYFFESSQEDVLSQASREDITLAHQTLETLEPGMEGLLAQAQTWEKQCNEAQDSVDVLRRVLADVEQTLSTLPQGIEIADYRERLAQMDVIAQSLHATLSRLEVENMSAVIQESTRQSQLGQEMGHELRRARRELASLESVLVELSEGFKALSLHLATLGAKSTHPVAWKTTMDALADLNRQANGLRCAARTRTPPQIIQDMEIAATIRSRQKALERTCDEIELAHTELLALLSGPELSQHEAWLTEARQVSRQAQVYPAENWSRGDAIASLAEELNALEAQAGQLPLANPSQAIPEDQVIDQLEAARQLVETSQRLKRRVANIHNRLEGLQESEKAAQQALESARSVLVQIGFIVRSNEFLSSAVLNEHERLSKEMQNLLDELAQRQRGSVDKKARQATALIDRTEQSVNAWLDRLGRDSQELTQELTATLKELDEIAALDDKPVAEARRLLTSGPLLTPAAKMRLPLDELLPEMKRRSDHWQACMAALNALGDFKPLIETHKEASFQRDKARKALSEATSGMRQKRAWPPTAVTLEVEREEFEKTEQQWQALREGQSRAIARVAQLSNLGARYQALVERIAQASERAAREQAEAEEQEALVNEAAQQWQNLLVEYQSNPQASQEIRELLDAIHHELAQIRRNYNQGSADYTQTLQALKGLIKRLRYYQAALDEENALDASGRVHRRRDSQRGERF